MLAEDGDGNYNHSDHVLLLLQLGSELSDSVRGDYTLKTCLQLLPSQDSRDAAVNQQSAHQGSLDILKMCFRYPGKSVDTFSQCPYRVGTTSARGTRQALFPHMDLLYWGVWARAW